MECVETLKNDIKEKMIVFFDLYNTEFKTTLKTSADVEKMINDYTTIYAYIAPRKQVLQILGNYKPGTMKKAKDKDGKIIKDKDGKDKEVPVYTKTIIYNYQKKKHKEITESVFMDIYSNLLQFCSLAEQLIMYKKIEAEDQEIKDLRLLISERIDKEKIREFIKE